MGAMDGALAKSARCAVSVGTAARVYVRCACAVRWRHAAHVPISRFCASSSTPDPRARAPPRPLALRECQVVSQESMKGVECQQQSVCVCARARGRTYTALCEE